MEYLETTLTQLKNILERLGSQLLSYIPNLLLALLVFFAGLLLAKLIRNIIRKGILYFNAGINEKLKISRLSIDLKGSAKTIATAFYWLIIVFTVALITQILEIYFLSKWIDGFINYIPNVLAALAIVFSGVILGKLLFDLIVSVSIRTKLINGKVLGNFARYIVLGISIIVAIDQLGIDISFIVIVISIVLGALLFGAALAFGLGAKTAVSNILSAYYILKNYEVGNTVQIGDTEGTITKITSTSVFLETPTGQVVVPAKDFSENKAIIKKNDP